MFVIFSKNNLATNITKRSCNLNQIYNSRYNLKHQGIKKFFDLNSSTETNTSKNHSIFSITYTAISRGKKSNTLQMNIFGLNDTTPTPVNTKEPVLNSSFNTTPVCQKGDFVIPSTSILQYECKSFIHSSSVEDIEISKKKAITSIK